MNSGSHQQTSSTNMGHVSGSSHKPTSSQILQTLPQGETPMDFLNNIVNREEPLNPQKVADSIKETRDAERTATQTVSEDSPVQENTPLKTDTIKVDTTPSTKVQDDIAPVTDLFTKDDKGTAGENFKKLRVAKAETEAKLKEAEERLAQRDQELEEYVTGKKVPEYVFEKEGEIERLRRFEELHSLKTSKAYSEKFVKPANEIKEKLLNIGNDYGIPADKMAEVFDITNRKEQNAWLEDHFGTLDALEVKKDLEAYQQIAVKAREAELEPGKVLSEIARENEVIETQKKQKLFSVMDEKTNTSWVRSLNKIKEEGKFLELIPKENDTRFNEEYVYPHHKAAASELGKIIARLAPKLSEPLDDEDMDYFSRMTLLAHSAATATQRSTAVEKTARELFQSVKRTNTYNRPPVGEAHAAGANGTPAPRPENREDRVNNLIEAGRASAKK